MTVRQGVIRLLGLIVVPPFSPGSLAQNPLLTGFLKVPAWHTQVCVCMRAPVGSSCLGVVCFYLPTQRPSICNML